MAFGVFGPGANVEIMIAGHQRHVGRRAKRFEEQPRRREFGRQRDVDEIAGDRDVVRRLRLQIADDPGKRLRQMDGLAAAVPVEEAEDALVGEIEGTGSCERSAGRQMGENKHAGAALSGGRMLLIPGYVAFSAANRFTPRLKMLL